MNEQDDHITTLLADAWSAVRAADLPDHVQGAALEIAAAILAEQAQPKRPGAPKVGAVPARLDPAATPEVPDSGPIPIDADAFFATLAEESGRSEDDLRRIYVVKDNEVRLGLTRSLLGDSEAAKNRAIATLLLGARYYAYGKKDLSLSEFRTAAKALNHEPSRNLATHLSQVPGTIATGTGNDKSVRVQEAKFKAAFDAAVDVIVGVS